MVRATLAGNLKDSWNLKTDEGTQPNQPNVPFFNIQFHSFYFTMETPWKFFVLLCFILRILWFYCIRSLAYIFLHMLKVWSLKLRSANESDQHRICMHENWFVIYLFILNWTCKWKKLMQCWYTEWICKSYKCQLEDFTHWESM